MTELIKKNDSRYFSQTSDEPYDRHYYKIVCQDNSFVVKSWDEVQEYWWNNFIHLGLKKQLFTLLINQNLKKVSNEFISYR